MNPCYLIFTLFPEVFPPYLESSILKRARENALLEVQLHNIRDWAIDKHHTTDDTPYGGGEGCDETEPVFSAVEAVLGKHPNCPCFCYLLKENYLIIKSTFIM
jgi:tRNA (guanine37-N1)-methyltransferase